MGLPKVYLRTLSCQLYEFLFYVITFHEMLSTCIGIVILSAIALMLCTQLGMRVRLYVSFVRPCQCNQSTHNQYDSYQLLGKLI